MNLKVKTKVNSSAIGKSRVYFCCHPDDFELYFKKICDDIFKTHDCAVYYAEDMSTEFEEQDIEFGIGRSNLLVIPVTHKLLTTPNRAMDTDFLYARSVGVPVLPFMMESGIDDLYSRPNRFGELQYLNPYSNDLTEISYENKLKKYLEAVLVSDELAKRIRAAFDAYIFLSYRKKDRKYANELMRLIHRNPEFRDIAVWYDEFLVPGESFNENITRMMNDSELFTLLVTPNLLEKPKGKPNFVMGQEYPAAHKMGLPIVPAEMEYTDKDELGREFKGIPGCVDPHEEDTFKKLLLQSLSRIAIAENNEDPEHNYLIGLAYLDGIDVEVDRTRGLELIKSAAKDGLLEAANELLKRAMAMGDIASDDFDELESLYSSAVDGLNANEQNISIESSFNLMFALYKLATIYNLKFQLSNAEECYLKSIEISETLIDSVYDSNKEVIAHVYFDYGVFCTYNIYGQATQETALHYLKKSLDLFEFLSFTRPSCKKFVEEAKIEIAIVKEKFTDDMMQANFRMMAENVERIGETAETNRRQFEYFISKGDRYEKSGQFNKAYYSYKAVLKKMEFIGDLDVFKMDPTEFNLIRADIYDRIAYCCEMFESYDEAKQFYTQAVLIATTEAKNSTNLEAYNAAINYLWKLATFCEEFGDKEEAKMHYDFRSFMLSEREKLQGSKNVDASESDGEDFLSPELRAELEKAFEELDFTPTTFEEGDEIDYSEGLFDAETEGGLFKGILDEISKLGLVGNFGEDEEENDDFVMLTNENGEEEKYEFLDLITIRNEEFVVLMPEDDDEKSVLILRVDESNEDGVDNYSSVDDDELLGLIFEIFKERNKDKFDFSE